MTSMIEQIRHARLPLPAWRQALWLAPLAFGLLSLLARQDNNWDLRNYHLYNPYALLNGKIGYDLAPAQMQTYFNPTIDLLYYGLIQVLPGPVVGFLMGMLHGLNFVLLACIARELLPRETGAGHTRLWILLALAGTLTPGFISELGNTMGDNLTALFLLASLLTILRGWRQLIAGQGTAVVVAAGAIAGLGCGLKLTNAVHALALCLALFALPANPLHRLRVSFLFGLGVLAGMALTGGYWHWKMWSLFGNPLFPQFNAFFHHPLAAEVGVADTRWLPRDLWEKILWPFIFGFNPLRISEIPLRMLLWPVLYLGFILLALTTLARQRFPSASHNGECLTDSRWRLLWIFFALAYFIWMNLFSIQRYLIPLELLGPLVLWLIGQQLHPGARAGRVVAALLLALTLSSFTLANWGRTWWTSDVYHADVPHIAAPENSLVLTFQADPPMGWLVTLFPARLAFASLASSFPEGRGYTERLQQMLAARTGPVYIIGKGEPDLLDLSAPPAQRARATAAALATQDEGQAVLRRYGLELELDRHSCTTHLARIGTKQSAYQICLAARTPQPTGTR